MLKRITVGVALCALVILVSRSAMAQPPRSVLIILDASSSMDVKTPRTDIENVPSSARDGMGSAPETKMTAAKRAVLDLVRGFPPETAVGLRVYGNSWNRWNPCRASQLLVPIAPNNRARLSAAMVGIQANGATPITHALRQAVMQDLAGINGPKSIILVSDGKETCDEDPCEIARQLARAGIDLKIDVIGFGVHDFATEQQLKCISAATLGKYTQADTYADLSRQLQNARAALVEERVEGRVMIPGVPFSQPSSPPSQVLPPPSSQVLSPSSATLQNLPDMESLTESLKPAAVNKSTPKKKITPPPPRRLPTSSR